MSRHLGLLAVLVLAPGAPARAHADEPRSPLVEMRDAAEARADIDPRGDRLQRPAPLLQKLNVAPFISSPPSRGALREAVRAAVRSEVARELAAPELSTEGGRGRGNLNRDKADKADKAQGGSDDAHGASEQARSAAIAAQEARRNSDVSKGNNGNGNGRGAGKPGKP